MKQKRSKTFKFVTGHILLCITIALHITVFLLSTRVSFFPGADVRRIHRYYECTVNCSPMTVTKEMCALAQQVSDELAQKTDVMT